VRGARAAAGLPRRRPLRAAGVLRACIRACAWARVRAFVRVRARVRRCACAAALACASGAAGCGGIKAPDLFLVQRSGSVPGAALTLLVNEEGGVHCNGGPEGKLADPDLIKARDISEQLKGPSAGRLSLPPGRESIFSYYVRDESGSVSFHDDSPRQPKVLRELQAFVLATAKGVCHLAL
jgi:hypothetical protein